MVILKRTHTQYTKAGGKVEQIAIELNHPNKKTDLNMLMKKHNMGLHGKGAGKRQRQ